MDIPRQSNPNPSPEDPEIHVGDFVVLTEGDPYYVGNAPTISEAFRTGALGRVVKKQWKALTTKEASALGKETMFEVAVQFTGAPRAYIFWESMLRKVRDPGLVAPRP